MNPLFRPPFFVKKAGSSLRAVWKGKLVVADAGRRNWTALTWIAKTFDSSFAHAGELVDSDGQVVKNLGRIFSVEVAS